LNPSNFTAHDCQLGDARIPYETLQRDYLCSLCGGGLVVRTVDGDAALEAVCSKCGCQDFIHHHQYERQVVEAWEIRRNLTPELRELLPAEQKTPGLTYEQAVRDLYGDITEEGS